MKLGQLKRKIVKEFAKSPAKTLILIALCPVALYFIVPLLLPASSQINESQKAKVIAQDLIQIPTAIASQTALSPLGNRPHWRQLNDWIAADWRRQSGTVAADQRNPFQPASEKEPAMEAVVEDLPTASEEPPAFSQEAFAAMQLKLTGTLVGRHSRSATISGRRYPEGAQVIPRSSEQSVADIEELILLKHVGARHAILEIEGVRFRLELDTTPPRHNGITVVRGQATTAP